MRREEGSGGRKGEREGNRRCSKCHASISCRASKGKGLRGLTVAIAFAISRCVVKWCAGALIRFFGSPANSNGDRGLSPPMGGRVMITDMLRPDADLGGSVVWVGGRSQGEK